MKNKQTNRQKHRKAKDQTDRQTKTQKRRKRKEQTDKQA